MEDYQVNITFDCSNKSYYPGQVVSGNIELILKQAKDFSAIQVQYIGNAVVGWDEKYDSYSDKEEYFNFTQLVFGGNGPTTLPPGTYKYPFQYQIPFTAPSTFQGCKGRIWYRVLAHVDVPGAKTVMVEEEFTVVSVVDLNADVEIMRPINLEFEEVYSCCCFDSSPVNIRVSLPASGYCPGQVMPVQVTVENQSSVEVQQMLFTIFSEESYRVRQPLSECTDPEKVIAQIKKGPVLTKTQKEFTVDFVIPDMIVPNLDNCELMDIHYYFKVFIKLTGCSDDNSDFTEIALGLIPLVSSDPSSKYVHPLKEKLPQGPIPVPAVVPVNNQAPFNYTQTAPQINKQLPFNYSQMAPQSNQAPFNYSQMAPQSNQAPFNYSQMAPQSNQATSYSPTAPQPNNQVPYNYSQMAPQLHNQAPFSYTQMAPQLNNQAAYNSQTGPQIGMPPLPDSSYPLR